jgi:hypothetical protein
MKTRITKLSLTDTSNFRNDVTANGNTDVIITKAQKMGTPLTLK